MRVLVTGAAGFLGSYVVPKLLHSGHSVKAMVRPGTSTASFGWRASAQIVEADLTTTPNLAEIVDDVDVVIHLAARVTGSDEERFASTVVGTERLLAAVVDSAVRRFVLISSYSVYDWSASVGALHEDSPVSVRPYERDGYTVAKVWQERIVREALQNSNKELVVLRPGFIYGPDHADVASAGIAVGRALLVVAPKAILPLTYVENCADCVVLAAVVPGASGHTMNVVDDYAISAWRYAKVFRSLLGARLRLPLPYSAARVMVQVIAFTSGRVFRHGGKLPGVLIPASFAARFKPLAHSARLARETLGWVPGVDFDDAARVTLRVGQGERAEGDPVDS